MAIVAHLGGSNVAGTDFASASAAAATSITINKPTGLANGMTLRAFVFSSVSAGAAMTAPSGWTLDLAIASRRGGLYSKKITNASAETATSYTWSTASAGRIMGGIWLDENEGATPIDVTGSWSAEGTAPTAASITPANAGDLLLQLTYWNNSSTTVTTVNVPSGFTEGLQVSSPTTGNTSGIDISLKQLTAAGATGTSAVTGTPTPTNMATVLIALTAAPVGGTATLSGSGSLSLGGTANPIATVGLGGTSTLNASSSTAGTGTASLSGSGSLTVGGVPAASATVALNGTGTLTTPTRVTQLLANPPVFNAHRGGSADWAEMTMDAYTKAAAWNSTMALEVSCIRTLDGYWMASHDSTTDRVFGVHYDITQTNWSTLQTLRTLNGNQPPALLVDILAAFPDRVFVVDNKMSSYLSEWLDLLAVYGGPSRIIVKGQAIKANDMAKADAARARGHKTWGYYYHEDTSLIASTHSHWDILGEDVVGTTPGNATDIAVLTATGKPWWAHIIANATQKAYADTLNPSGYMVSGVQEVVPQTPAPVALGGSSSLGAAGAPAFPSTAALSGSSVLTVSGLAGGGDSTAFTGIGVLTVTANPRMTGALVLSGESTLRTAGAVSPRRDITVQVFGPTRHPLEISGPARHPLTVSGATT